MTTVILVVHLMVAVSLVAVILLQKSEGGALGLGGGGMSGFMTGRSTANLLTRTTAILAVAFFATSVLLVVLSQRTGESRSLIDQGPPPSTQETPSGPVAPATPAAPATPPGPSAPLAK